MKVKKNLFWVVLFFVVVLVVGVFFFTGRQGGVELVPFAKCLTDKGAVMYGTYWCSHCKAQKAAFGKSFEFVNYVECTVDTDKCTEDKINGFPTWVINGTHYEGKMDLSELASLTGCVLPSVS
jgi:glutaredoxin